MDDPVEARTAPLALRLAIPVALAWIGAAGAWTETRLRAQGLGGATTLRWGAPWAVLVALAAVALLALALRRHPRARLALVVAAGLLFVYRFTELPVLLAFLGYGDFGALFAPLAAELRPLATVLLAQVLSDMALAAAVVLLVLRGDVSRWLAPRAW